MKYAIDIIVTLILIPWPGIIMMSPMMVASKGFGEEKSSIISAFIILNYPVILFLLLKLAGLNFYGTDPLWWALGIAIVSGSVTGAYGLVRKLYNTHTGIPNHGFYKTEKKVYRNGKPIKGADPATFTIFKEPNDYYSKDAFHVYAQTKRVAGADAATFKPVGDDLNLYWKDRHSVYARWIKLPGAHGESFEYIGQGYGRDKDRVYFEDMVLEKADPDSFVALESFVGGDKNNVYVKTYPATNIKDLASFKMIRLKEELFGRDNYHIYAIYYNRPHPFEIFPEADLETFEPIDEFYAKDKNRIYHYSYHKGRVAIVEEANPKTFVVEYNGLTNSDARDEEKLYYAGELLKSEKPVEQ